MQKDMYSTSYLGMHSRNETIKGESLRESDSFNLDRNTFGKFLDGNTTTSRLVRKVLLVHAVHLCEILHVGEEDGGL